MEYNINIVRIISAILRKWWLVLLVTIGVTAVGVASTWQASPNIYNTQATLISVASSQYSSTQSTLIMRDYADLIKSKQIADRVVQALPEYYLNAFVVQAMVDYSYNMESTSAMLSITAKSEDPELAVLVANEVATAFIDELQRATGVEIARIIDKAGMTTLIFNGMSHQLRLRLYYAAAGFILACVFLAARVMISKKITSVQDCTLNGEISVLAIIPKHSV